MANERNEKRFFPVTPNENKWRPFDAFHNAVRLAILVGRPGEVGPYVVRMSVPANVRVVPHVQDHDRVYTVLTLHFAEGRKVGELEPRPFPTGSVIVVPNEYHHFGAETEPVVFQITAVGRTPGSS